MGSRVTHIVQDPVRYITQIDQLKGFCYGFACFIYPPGNDHISHLGKRNIILSATDLVGDMLVPWYIPGG